LICYGASVADRTFSRDHYPPGAVGLPPAAESLGHATKFGSSSLESFGAGRAAGAEDSSQE